MMTRRTREVSFVSVLWFVCLWALTLLLTACGREATAPEFRCESVQVTASDTIPRALVPGVVVCVEAK